MKGLKRIQLFEFEDLKWFPNWMRSCMTNLLVVLQKMLGIREVLADLIAGVIKDSSIDQIVDLGSGSGGIMPEVFQTLQEEYHLTSIKMTLTDLYPNKDLVERINSEIKLSGLSYNPKSVDATNFKEIPPGLKTMVNSFHHMPPQQAREILASAQSANQPLLIYEMGENKIPVLVWALLLPISLAILMLMVLFMTPFVRPLNWQQIVFTYLIPFIPLCYAWDGQASLPRMYATKDVEYLISTLETTSYNWKLGHATRKSGKKMGNFILGTPSQ
jgi:hypothetical protein